MDQNATEVGLGPGDIVLDGNPAPPTDRGTAAPPHFSAHVYYGRPSYQLLSSCSLCGGASVVPLLRCVLAGVG